MSRIAPFLEPLRGPSSARRRRVTPYQHMQLRAVAVILAVLALVLLTPHDIAHAQDGNSFGAFVASLWPEASRKGVSRKIFDRAFSGLTPDSMILAKTQSQAEFVKPIGDYLASSVSPKRIAKGREKMAELEPTLQRISARYGVDPYILLAVWGMESNFGDNCGATSVIRDLATLAYARYRGAYFRHELIVALQILQQGHVSLAGMQGSWAGAMGQTQFMPSSFMRYAVDFDETGHKNIWTSATDALASTANFLARHGWVRGWTWGYEALPPSGRLPIGRTQTFAAWAAQGYRRADGVGMPREGVATLAAPAGEGGPFFLTTKNFSIIKSYNSSTAYALGVSLLSDRIAGEGPLKGTWRSEDFPTASLSR